ncbi:MAG: hypothetical protein IKD14_04250 [Clostridia bacterium]|nr:hypothetical protein [Clostridia bacterium]MBR7136320.1 hypothetical protein [Clostridia bacterium]
MQDKIRSYIGFAIRAGKVRTGVNAISTLKKSVPLLLLCSTASPNTVKDAVKLATNLKARLVVSKAETLENIFNKQNCKLAAIMEPSLAAAIIDNLNEKFVEFGG